MKLGTQGSSAVIESSGVYDEQAFSMACTPHMFQLLSDGLYSDKVAAVLREVGCNAADAHIEQGTPERPFEVKLPTVLDRTFYVCDHGPGLSHQNMTRLYTTFGASTKQESNEVTGAFGLGSKSPLAYTMQNKESRDGFTVMSAHDGVKRIYTCQLGDNGIPTISLLHEEPANDEWPHGLMVTFAVQAKDIDLFHKKAAQVFRWFRVKPKLIGYNGSPEDLDEPEYSFNNKYCALPHSTSGYQVPCVVMGNVCYPIDITKLEIESAYEDLLLCAGIRLKAEIGDVVMTPSREALQYTQKTRECIQKYLKLASSAIASHLAGAVVRGENETMWDWRRRIGKLSESLPGGLLYGPLEELLAPRGYPSEHIEHIVGLLRVNTIALPDWVRSGRADSFRPVEERQNLPEPAMVSVWACRERERAHAKSFLKQRLTGISSKGKTVLAPQENPVIVVGDCKHAEKRLGLALAGMEHGVILLVKPDKAADIKAAQRFAQEMVGEHGISGIPVVQASSLALPEVKQQTAGSKTPRNASRTRAMDSTAWVVTPEGVYPGEVEDIPENGKFWAVCSNIKGSYALVRGNGMRFYAGKACAMAQHVQVVAKYAGIDFSGFVVVARDSAARRLKLEQRGFTPLLGWLCKIVTENVAKVHEELEKTDPLPDIDLKDRNPGIHAGWAGYAASAIERGTKFGRAFEDRLRGSVLHMEAMRLVSRYRRDCDNGVSAMVAADALKCLMSAIFGADESIYRSINGLPCRTIGAWKYQMNLIELLPSLKYLSLDRIEEPELEDDTLIEMLLGFLANVLQRDVPQSQETSQLLAA